MTLESAWAKQWQDVLGDTGFAKLTIDNEDPDLATLNYGDIVQFLLLGTPRFLMLVEKKDRVSVDPSEEVALATTVSGRGALAILEDAVVYPDLYIETVPFADARIFNFSSLFAVDTDNGYATNSTGIYDWGVYTSAGPYTNTPAGFPDATAHWLGPQAPSGVPDHPVGDWYVSSLLIGIDEGQYRLSVSADDSVDIYIDNVPLQKAEGVYGRLITIDLWLDSALHHLAFKVTNLPPPHGGPSGLIWSLQEMNADGTVGAVVWHSHPSGSVNDFYSAYPANPPGFTPGQVMDILLLEAQDTERGCFPLLTYDFDDAADSAGVAWAERIQPSFQVGADLLTVIKQLGETYFVPMMDPDLTGGLVLHAYQSVAGASLAEFQPGVNITALQHHGAI